MKKPFWVNFIGVLMILGGVLGVLGGIFSNSMSSLGQNKIENEEFYIQQQLDQLHAKKTNPSPEELKGAKQEGKEVFNRLNSVFSDSIFKNIFQPILALITFISGVLLVMIKPYAIKFFYIAIACSFLAAAYAYFNLGEVGAVFGSITAYGLLFDVFVDFVFLLIVFLGDKSIFNKNSTEKVASGEHV